MKYYTSEIKNLYIKSISISNDVQKVVLDNFVIIQNAPFYLNRFGKFISFEYNTVLPTKEEAENYILGVIKNNPNNSKNATCIYVDYKNMNAHTISKKDFVLLKKKHKKNHN